MEQIKQYLSSRPLRVIVYTLAAIIALLLVFTAGMLAGFSHVRLQRRFDAHMPPPPYGAAPTGGFPHLLFDAGGHGVIGTISSIALPEITIVSRDGTSRTIVLASTTALRNDRGDASTSALSLGDTIVAIGVPQGNGEITTKLIRILSIPPPPPAQPSTQY